MEIVVNIDNKENIIKLDKNVVFFGKNSNYKNKVINSITNGLLGKTKNKQCGVQFMMPLRIILLVRVNVSAELTEINLLH